MWAVSCTTSSSMSERNPMTPVKVSDLIPGDVVVKVGIDLQGLFVAQTRHPLWTELQLVIWCLSDDAWSFDALRPDQHVGEALPSTHAERQERLREVLVGKWVHE